MLRLNIIKHEDISQKDLDEIISIKTVAWPYAYMDQVEWINSHLKKTDLHFILYDDSNPVAYLNILNIKLKIDKHINPGYGIGNVCVKEKRKGYGRELLIQTNGYVASNNKIGVLFCKSDLVDFYNKCNWYTMDKQKLQLSFDNQYIETMIFSTNKRFSKIEYLGQSF